VSTRVLIGDCRASLAQLPERSIHCAVTSPPYWGLRDYGAPGQLGREATPEAFVAGMVDVFRAVHRVLRDDGTLWLNLGDCYTQSGRKCDTGLEATPGARRVASNASRPARDRGEITGLKAKDLVGIPWRVAFALQAAGWYLRSDIVWQKPNPMPEPVRDRPTRAHEFVFLLAKSPRYFYDADAVREPHAAKTLASFGKGTSKGRAYGRDGQQDPSGMVASGGFGASAESKGQTRVLDARGRNRRDVWTVAPRPYKGAHFAVMPPGIVEPCVLAGTSAHGCCEACGAPWSRVVERTSSIGTRAPNKGVIAGAVDRHRGTHDRAGGFEGGGAVTTGWAPGCKCGAGVVPCVVLDPFGGSGTVAMVANQHGRDAVLCELNPAYAPLIEARIAGASGASNDNGETHKAVGT